MGPLKANLDVLEKRKSDLNPGKSGFLKMSYKLGYCKAASWDQKFASCRAVIVVVGRTSCLMQEPCSHLLNPYLQTPLLCATKITSTTKLFSDKKTYKGIPNQGNVESRAVGEEGSVSILFIKGRDCKGNQLFSSFTSTILAQQTQRRYLLWRRIQMLRLTHKTMETTCYRPIVA